MIAKTDGSWHCFVEENKNRSRKQRGALLFFGKGFNKMFQLWLDFRVKNEVLGHYVWCNFNGSALTASQLSTRLKHVCQKHFPDFTGGTPLQLRFLQSAHIWSKFQSGEIPLAQMEKLATMYDRTLETWGKDYCFSDDLFDRHPGEENLSLLWTLDINTDNNELEFLDYIANLRKIHKKAQFNNQSRMKVPSHSYSSANYSRMETKSSETEDETTWTTDTEEEDAPSKIGKEEPCPVDAVRTSSPSSNSIHSDKSSGNLLAISNPLFGLHISQASLDMLLKPNSWLEDDIVGGCLQFLYQTVLNHKQWDRPHYNPSIFVTHGTTSFSIKTQVLQHINDQNMHWFLSMIKCVGDRYVVTVIDSLNRKSLSTSTKKMFDIFLGQDKYDLCFVEVQHQMDSSSCGVFTVAFATEIAFGNLRNLSSVKFDYGKMRKHLHDCLIAQKLQLFPKA